MVMMEDETESIEMSSPNARRTFTLRNKVARHVVNFMPSRQMPYNTLRLRRVNSEQNALLQESMADAPDAVDKQADIIVRELEQNRQLMEDNPVSEELRREALRDLPQGLTMKRNIRAKLSASVSLRSQRRPISLFKRLKYRFSFTWKRWRDRSRDFFFSIELWYEAIRHIEGNLGSAVGSYFYFLRWLFIINLMLSVFIICFVVVPQALYDSGRNYTVSLKPLDFISGMGGMEDTLLFYGHYHDGPVNTGPLHYDMAYAYFYTMLCLYLVFFVVLCYRTADSYRRYFIEPAGSGEVRHVLATKLFCGWDFGIASPRAAGLAARALYHEFKELLVEQNRKQVVMTFWVRVLRRAANTAVWALVLGAILGTQYALWLLLGAARGGRPDLTRVYVSMAVTAVVCVCPVLLSQVVRLEFYDARTAFYVTVARTWLLDTCTLVLMLFYWVKSEETCWETRVGQEVYRLVVLDVFISLILLPGIEFARALLFRLKWVRCAPEFLLAHGALTLLHNQACLWAALAFAPLLAPALAAKCLLLFHVRRAAALAACHTARKVWRAAQTQTVLYMLVTLSLFTTLFALGSLYLGSSPACGPLRRFPRVFDAVSEGLLRLSARASLRAALLFATRPGPIAFLMLTLCVAVYTMRARAAAQRSIARLLRHMLRLQAKDKDFLLSAIDKVSNGEWLYSPKPENEGPESHTWKYLQEVRKPSNADYNFDASRLSHAFLDRPRSYINENRPTSYGDKQKSNEDGDTDSSFSWQGSSSYLNRNDVEDK